MQPTLALFDLETGPLPLETLAPLMPQFEAPANFKNLDAIAKAIEEKRQKWIDDAALSPITGEIVVCTWLAPLPSGGYAAPVVINANEVGEAELIRGVFDCIEGAGMGSRYKVGGWNIFDFDLPFLVRRALHHGIALPTGLVRAHGRWAEWASWLIDLRAIWALGQRDARGDMGQVARLFGGQGKTGHGAYFAALWRDPRRHGEAEAYLKGEADCLQTIARGLAPLLRSEVELRGSREPARPTDQRGDSNIPGDF